MAARIAELRDPDELLRRIVEESRRLLGSDGAHLTRMSEEGTDLIIEGAHLVPGFADLSRFQGNAVVVPMVVTVDDEEVHRSHILKRASEAGNRPAERYLHLFQNIRKMQRYVKSLALQHEVPIVPSYSLDATLSQIIELVVGQAMEAVPARGA